MYADDLLIMCRAKPQEATVVDECFKKYCEWSSQQANVNKSSIIFSKNTSKRDKKTIKAVLGFKEMGSNSIYLGNSLAGKVTLLKSVAQALPTYSMATFQIPRGICDELDALARKLWWETKPNSTRDSNTALLAKLAWNLAVGKDKLWTRLLTSKYLKGDSFFEHKLKTGASWIWKGILNSRNLIKAGSCFKLDNGASINLWTDPWLPGLPNKSPRPTDGGVISDGQRVYEFRDLDSGSWNKLIIRSLCDDDSVNAILKLVWPPTSVQDKLLWTGNKEGGFSVSSCYNLKFRNHLPLGKSICWKKLWQLNLHERQTLLWRMISNAIPSKEVLVARLGDAAMLVKEIANQSDPTLSWFTYFEMTEIRARFQKFNWSLKWNARSANGLADLIAKKALAGSSFFDLNCILDLLPNDILTMCALDRLGKDVCNPPSGGQESVHLCSYTAKPAHTRAKK
ncbi:hypothetical protein FEM48_Zijuj03G0084200 [Ziziphus jujuba var. spinosa]|uniref:Reverse transcriptase domain-containing protein n=1 Tax=Ziziphus jujuba var. spinosa TaxID=714518 RepID=A0A978VP84_ZIZJJ|nr:hypothetical protein FEM48_Zijuj03G0084200 [Ziziphus jujuba var. spinosa]